MLCVNCGTSFRFNQIKSVAPHLKFFALRIFGSRAMQRKSVRRFQVGELTEIQDRQKSIQINELFLKIATV